MISDIFKNIKDTAMERAQSFNWYKDKISKMKQKGLLSIKNVISNAEDLPVNRVEIGSMYMFIYDPKYKKTLPVWDAFPIVIPFSMNNEIFTGFNFHYLSTPLRWKMLNILMSNQEIATRKNLNYNSRIQLDYSMLKKTSHIPILKPTIHSYRYDHVIPSARGRYMKVHPSSWKFTVLLPTQDFRYNTLKGR